MVLWEKGALASCGLRNDFLQALSKEPTTREQEAGEGFLGGRGQDLNQMEQRIAIALAVTIVARLAVLRETSQRNLEECRS